MHRLDWILLFLAATFSACFLLLWPPGEAHAQGNQANVIINEILARPLPKTEPREFVELYNASAAPVDLSQWSLADGVDFVFPSGVILPPGGYLVVAQNPAALKAAYGVEALGPFRGRLDNDGETVELQNARGDTVDKVVYGLGFPWPLPGGPPEQSIQLVNPALERQQPGYWRSAPPTPGGPNATLVINPPPVVAAVAHTPQSPTSQEAIRITATITDADGVADVQLLYQIVAPGRYIRLWDEAYQTQWASMPMLDAGNGIFVAEMPPEARIHRHLVRYRIVATDRAGQQVAVPYADDPQPNFAYFVYDALPIWHGAVNPSADDGQSQRMAFDFGAMRPLPVYHLIAQRSDVEDAQFIPNAGRVEGYMGTDYLWWGTLVYDGRVYDHIGFRARGGLHRYAVGKNMWKFNFNRGHRLQAHDDWGQPYGELWDKLNFSAVIQHANRGHRGEQGLFESLGFRLFNLVDVPASNTHFVHFRVIDSPDEHGQNQYLGDFWGLYLAIQEVDGQFLDTHGLPDGNLYRMEHGTGELNNQGPNAPADKSDLNAFLDGYLHGQPDADWWRQHLDLPAYYSYRAIIEAIHHYDVNEGKNYLYYHHPETERWSVFPWDLDLTWADTMPGDGNEPFRDPVLSLPEFQIEYQNRLREVRDLLFNPDQLFPMLDEYAAFINTPADGLAMVDADRAKWDYNPILDDERYTVSHRAGHGKFYKRAPSRDFAGMVQVMREWVLSRSQWIDETLLTDPFIPQTPALVYRGPHAFPADQLTFETSPFADDHAGFAAMQWRVAEVMHPGLPGYTPGQPNRYEIEASWQSAPLSTFSPTLTLPQGACLPGRVCRVRVRVKNQLGRWSHWSHPVEFVAGPPALPPSASLKITEIMYHPLRTSQAQEPDYEFVELKNVGDTAVELSHLRFAEGISYTFPVGLWLQPGQMVALASNPERFAERYGFVPLGPYRQKLNNSGDRLVVLDAFSRLVLNVTYADTPPWPLTADGLGHSLVLNAPHRPLNPDDGGNWRASFLPGGSPGVDDPLPLVINEVLAHPAAGESAWIELYNPTGYEAALSGWAIIDTLGTRRTLPPAILPPQSYHLFTLAELRQAGGGFALRSQEGTLRLQAPAIGTIHPYEHIATYRVAPRGVASGRHINTAGQERFALQRANSPGAPNAPPAVGPVVMSRIMARAERGLEFIEFTNITDQPVQLFDPDRPENSWRLNGVLFVFPVGNVLPPHGKLVVTTQEPLTVCGGYRVADDVRVLGPLPLALADGGQRLALERPLPPTADGVVRYVVVDEVAYTNLPPWPRLTERGASLARIRLSDYGDDPLNWRRGQRADDLIQPAGVAPVVDLCSFDVYRNTEGLLMIEWATRSEEQVTGYALWRSADSRREHATPLTREIVAAQGDADQGAGYSWVDDAADQQVDYTYWLVALGPENTEVDVAFTAVRPALYELRLPFVYR